MKGDVRHRVATPLRGEREAEDERRLDAFSDGFFAGFFVCLLVVLILAVAAYRGMFP